MHNKDLITHFLLEEMIQSRIQKQGHLKVSVSALSECDVNVKWLRRCGQIYPLMLRTEK